MPRPRDRLPLTDDRRALAARFLPLARALARPLKARWPVAEDEFESAACFALIEAAETFDPARGVKFSTFARHRIWGALRDVQRQQILYGWRSGVIASDEAAPMAIGLAPSLHEPMGRVLCAEPDDPVGWAVEAIEEVERWLRKLPPQHARVCRLIYLYGKTCKEAARMMGLSPTRTLFIRGEALAMLNGTWDARVREGA